MTPAGKTVALVAAVARNGVIGNGPDIPWRVPGEQAEFKRITWGHVLVMGRTTYESIGRPLPGRSTVVLTRDPGWSAEGVVVALDVAAALAAADDLPGAVMVAGGGEVYRAMLPHADEAWISEIDQEPAGDVHFPELGSAWREQSREPREGYDLVHLTRAG